MKKSIFLSFFILCNLMMFAQKNISLTGKLLYGNSGKLPAENIKVTIALKQNKQVNTSCFAKKDGTYSFTLPKANEGDLLVLTLENTDKNEPPIRVTNNFVLETCRIPSNSTELPPIFVAKEENIHKVEERYVKILKLSAKQALVQKKQQLNNLLNETNKDIKAIALMQAQIKAIEPYIYDSITLAKEGRNLIAINKDFASENVKKYLTHLEEARMIQDGYSLLDEKAAVARLATYHTQFNEAIEEIETLAGAYSGIFQYEQATACYEKIAQYYEENYKDELLATHYYNKIAPLLLMQNQGEKALSYNEKALHIQEKILPSQDSILAYSYSNIANTYSHLQKYQEAIVYREKALKIMKLTLSPQNIDVASEYGNLSLEYGSIHQYEKALTNLQNAIEMRKATAISVNLGTDYRNLSIVYESLGQEKKAVEYVKKAIDVYEEILKPKHALLWETYLHLASLYNSTGEYSKAMEYCQKVLKMQEHSLNPLNPDLATTYDNLAMTYQRFTEYEKSLEYGEKAIAIKEASLGKESPSLAFTYNIMAMDYQYLKEYDKMLPLYQKALAVQEKSLDSLDFDLATTYNDISMIYGYQQETEKAFYYLEKAVRIFTQILPKENTTLLQAQENLAMMYLYQGGIELDKDNVEGALEYLLKGLKYKEEPSSWVRVGLCYYYKEDYPKAIESYLKAEKISPLVHSPNFYHNLALAYAHNKDFAKAKVAFQQRQSYAPDAYETYIDWARYYALKGEKNKVIESIEKAISLGFKNEEAIENEINFREMRENKVFLQLLKR